MFGTGEENSVKRDVVLLCGGRSAEHEISLISAASVMRNLDPDRYRLEILGIRKDGSTMTAGELAEALQVRSGERVDLPDVPSWVVWLAGRAASRPRELVVFPVLHGPYGEDGTVQGLLEVLDLPYVGASVGGSAVGMNKIYCKRILESAGLPVLPWSAFHREAWGRDSDACRRRLDSVLGWPRFVKPANLGSSVGISRCLEDGLAAAVELALRYDDWVVVEQGIDAREIEVSVLGGFEPAASQPGEIIPADVFYSYEAKYLDDRSQLLIPAPLDAEQARQVQELAVRAFEVLQLEGMARMDFLMDRRSGRFWINEPNTIPGFTRISMYPKLWAVSGLPFPDLLDRLLDLAVERHRRRSRLEVSR